MRSNNKTNILNPMQSLKNQTIYKATYYHSRPLGKRGQVCASFLHGSSLLPLPKGEAHCAQWAAWSPEWHLLGADWHEKNHINNDLYQT